MYASAGKLVLTIPEFVTKWQNTKLSERSAAQSHFIDLCTVLDQQTPVDVDSEGNTYTFEKGVEKNSGGDGFADVWKRNFFAWEYKRKHENLAKAYQQLLKYREALENPPLLVVCDLERFEIHTNWTNTPPEVYSFSLQDLVTNIPTETCKVPPVDVLRSLFTDPERLKPGQTTAQVTTQAAKEFSTLAKGLRDRGIPAERAAHFIMRLLFCLFAEDIGLLPDQLFTRLIQNNRRKPVEFAKKLRQLFAAMSTEGGSFGPDDIQYFDGGLFMDDKAYELTAEELGVLARAAQLNWGGIEPAIFGTLFERILDPDKRSQIGAHYTSKEDIMLIVEPVLMEPLRREWEVVRQKATKLIEEGPGRKGKNVQKDLSKLLGDFVARVASVRVLDPACGSGNFLYVALKLLLDLEKQVSVFASSNRLSRFFVRCRPNQLYGIESNIYAHQVASVSVWIGFLQWQRDNGIIITDNPIMQPIESIKCMDAILDQGRLSEPEWPEVDVIIGNPPFLGDKKMRQELGDEYVKELRRLYDGRVPGGADLVTFWFERARQQVQAGKAQRVGLLATNSISMIANRKVLERIKETGDIFMAWSDKPWVLDGAAVRVSVIGFDNGTQKEKILDGAQVLNINADLTTGLDVTSAQRLSENRELCFLGIMKGGPFDVDDKTAQQMLSAPLNPNGKPNSDVVKRRLGGQDVTGKARGGWIINFGQMDKAQAALYELPFEYVKKHVKPLRDKKRDAIMRRDWWLPGRSRPALRKALSGLKRCIVTPEVSKHRIFAWMDTETVPDHKLHVIARADDYMFGVLQSRIHEAWSLAQCSWIGVGNDPSYSSSRTFETFPFPWPPGKEPAVDSRLKKIADAARDLVTKRDAWLNPSGATDAEKRKRTLTKLYNANPDWLQDANHKLNEAVLGAYGWQGNLSDSELLTRLLLLNRDRFAKQGNDVAVLFQEAESELEPRKVPTSVRRSTTKKRISPS
jgi:type II restriction/modification system DNA methylase subunit YeeA